MKPEYKITKAISNYFFIKYSSNQQRNYCNILNKQNQAKCPMLEMQRYSIAEKNVKES